MAMICVNGCRECNGCMACQPEPEPVYCEVCGKECDTIYKNKYGEVVGCDCCISIIDATDYDE